MYCIYICVYFILSIRIYDTMVDRMHENKNGYPDPITIFAKLCAETHKKRPVQHIISCKSLDHFLFLVNALVGHWVLRYIIQPIFVK